MGHGSDSKYAGGVRSGDFPYFRRTWNIVVVTLLVASLVPLIVIGGGVYFYLTSVIKQKTIETLRMHSVDLKKQVDEFLSERTKDLRLISENMGLSGLRDPDKLQKVFNSLQRQLPCYSDLGIIDDRGNHLSYIGPYDLIMKNYRETDWFKTVIARGEYVSDVFLGFRNVPHFVIVVKAFGNQGDWFIRATIDTDYFQGMIAEVAEKSSANAYFVNQEGIYQSRPASSGHLMEQSPFRSPVHFNGVRFHEEDGHLLMSVWMKNVPWLCVVQMDRKKAFGDLRRVRVIGVWVVILAAILIVMSVLLTTNYLVSRLEFNRRRIQLLDRQLRRSNRLELTMESTIGLIRENKDALVNIDATAMNVQNLCHGNPVEEITDGISQIRSEAARGLAAINKFQRLNRGYEPVIRALEINKVLDDSIDYMEDRLRFSNIRIVRHYEESLPVIRSDISNLRQVFQNLILNAATAIQNQGEIILTTRRESDGVLIMVADTGPGIAADHMDKIFDPLFTTKPDGTGLGLTSCVDILERLGGQIYARNRPEGGACFVVKLPLQFDHKADNT